MLDSIWKDLRYATRSLARTPAFTAAALLTLALGIGANTAIFSLMNAVLLRTLPLTAPGELVFVGYRNPTDPEQNVNLLSNPAWLQRIRQETGVFSGVAGYNIRDFKVASAAGVEQLVGQYATGNYHSLLGVRMALGRGFAGEDDFVPGANPVAVISDSYWERRYQRNPDVLGRTLVVGGRTATIVGVTAAGFDGLQPGRSIELTLPLWVRVADEPDWIESLDSWTGMPLVARLKPGVTAAAAEPVVHAAYREHMTRPGIGFGRTRDGRFTLTAAVVPAARGADRLRREYEPALTVLMGIVGAVLLIACVNVANLFFARNAARAGEVAVRLAIGAGRRRIVRQLLTEGALLATAGGLLGFVAAGWATRYVAALLRESQRPIVIDAQPDTPVLLFTLAVAAVTTLLFGLAPAVRTTRLAPLTRLSAGSTTATRSSGRMVLVGAQVAICVVLVFGAALLVRTLRNLQAVDGRFARDNVVTFAIDAIDTPFPLERLPQLCADAIARLRQPGVTGGACSTMTPLDTAREVRVLGLPALPPGRNTRDVLANAVSPEYFQTLGMTAVRGRLLDDGDTAASTRVAVINEAAARHFFADLDPIGRQIGFSSRPDPRFAITVVGIVADVRFWLRETPEPMVFQPLTQMRQPPEYLVASMHTTGDALAIAARARDAVRDLSTEIAVPWVRTMREQMTAALVGERLLAGLSSAFGLLALLLAAVGVYGVIAYDVARRSREIGIRLALGAQRSAVIADIVRSVALMVMPGLAAGVLAATLASAGVEAFLYGITPRDPSTLALAAAVLLAVAFAAAALPARRAARVNPAVALRAE